MVIEPIPAITGASLCAKCGGWGHQDCSECLGLGTLPVTKKKLLNDKHFRSACKRYRKFPHNRKLRKLVEIRDRHPEYHPDYDPEYDPDDYSHSTADLYNQPEYSYY